MWWDTNGIMTGIWTGYEWNIEKPIIPNHDYYWLVWLNYSDLTSVYPHWNDGTCNDASHGKKLSLKEPSFRLVNYRHSARYDGDVMGYPWLINRILRDINGTFMDFLWANELRWVLFPLLGLLKRGFSHSTTGDDNKHCTKPVLRILFLKGQYWMWRDIENQ